MAGITLNLIDLGYKKDKAALAKCANFVAADMAISLDTAPASWHELDALLALRAALRYRSESHVTVGLPTEGLIYL